MPVSSDDVGLGLATAGQRIEVEAPTSYKFLGMTDGPQTIVRAVLKSWTQLLGADPGPALVEFNPGTAGERADVCAGISPAEARAVARALLVLAATAERDGPFSR
jgi:hypothetical protein